MSEINKVAVVSRLPKTTFFKESDRIVKHLIEKHHLDVYLNESFGKKLTHTKTIKMEQLKDFDLIIALGGDGTILWTARYSQDVPLFGINAGHLGFLTTSTLENALPSIDKIMSGAFIEEHCMRIQATVNGRPLTTALNEFYITNRLSAHICELNLFVNNFNLGKHLLDGILISTPVGSTAYALSAGGAIIEYSLKAMQIVPVNSVSRRIRPFVVPGDFKITITVPSSFTDEIIILSDGILEAKFESDTRLELTRAEIETVFVRFPEYGFFNRLQDKLTF